MTTKCVTNILTTYVFIETIFVVKLQSREPDYFLQGDAYRLLEICHSEMVWCNAFTFLSQESPTMTFVLIGTSYIAIKHQLTINTN